LALSGSNLYVYTGCSSACLAHGPFLLTGPATFGSLGDGDETFMTMDIGDLGPSIDVYVYEGIYGLEYLWSNGEGLNPNDAPQGIAQRLN
jgi:hypothetical protein